MNKNHAKPLLAGVLALSLAGALTGALTGCGPKAGGPGETQKKGTAVETQTVSAGEIATKNQLSGKVVPRDEVSIFAPQEADVLSLNVSVGDTVSSGMVLFTLDSASVQRQITQVEGERGRTASLYDEQISQARETLSTTKTLTDEQLRQAEQSRDNTKKLHELGAASDIELEKAEASYVETKLNAQSSVQSAELSISRLETEKANQLSNYDKTLADLREQLDDLSVKATVSGTVTAVNRKGRMAAWGHTS
ncbi:MAG: HlyD family secretion protein, partial [Butyricicoccus sp.]